jgi:hypothetical protein
VLFPLVVGRAPRYGTKLNFQALSVPALLDDPEHRLAEGARSRSVLDAVRVALARRLAPAVT